MNIQQTKNHQELKHSEQMRILIVDDAQDILESLKDILEMEIDNCVIEMANNVEAAKKIAQKTKPDIALLDIKIGQDSGLDLIPELKLISNDMVCIMMTAFRDNEYTVTAVRFGASDYLYKPIKPVDLIQTVTRLFNEQSVKRKVEIAEKRFVTVFEQGTQWLFILTKEGMLIDANVTAMSFIGEEKKDVLGLKFSNSVWFISSVEAQKIIENGLLKVKEGGLYNSEIKLTDQDENNKIFDFYMKPIFDSEKEVTQIVVESRDITDKKEAEAEIKALNEALELRVKERTIELEQSLMLLEEENRDRKKAEDKAEKASAAKSEFLSRMSHELRTPMNAILGFGQLLEVDIDEFSTLHQGFISEIMDAGNHLLSLINQVLDLASIESGKLELYIEAVKLDDVIKESASMMMPLINEKQLTLIDNVSNNKLVAQADFERTKQVLLNLLSNAVKYNRESGNVTLDSEVINNRLRISITDQGEGLSKEDIDKLFKSFERLNTTFNVEGAGIGLVISKNLVDLMNGSIGVESKLGEGSRFWFELPLVNT